MTRVAHCKREPYDVYIGRPGPFGNPFRIGHDGDRTAVLAKYIAWFYQPEQAALRERAARELQGKVLGCWCVPLPCHGDIIAGYLNGLA